MIPSLGMLCLVSKSKKVWLSSSCPITAHKIGVPPKAFIFKAKNGPPNWRSEMRVVHEI